MRYRKDLKKYDDPIEKPPSEIVFRYHLSENPEIYKMLFELAEDEHPDLKEKAMILLFRLPTFKGTLEECEQSLNLKEKNSFQTEYLLIAIQSYLSLDENKSERKKTFI